MIKIKTEQTCKVVSGSNTKVTKCALPEPREAAPRVKWLSGNCEDLNWDPPDWCEAMCVDTSLYPVLLFLETQGSLGPERCVPACGHSGEQQETLSPGGK